ncbi:MAG TPA: ATP-dependent helicase HrpB [Gemmatimonadales bacterium]|nr:ATP-dependent helicase HrpB [Gemmatimonadales bacterium]
MPDLPIEPVLPALRAALRDRTAAVLQAPPGSGKTTRVPLALLVEPWLAGARIVMLEPRRLAARAAATWMAHLLNEPVGGIVGYRVRGDTRVGPRTRIEVVTEGVLTRMVQADPALEGIGLVVFDEFHERSVHADLGLALTLHSQGILRDDLRVLVMSATLDGEVVSALLGGAPVLTGEGRAYPVETIYRAPRPEARLEATTAAAVLDALAHEDGDVLVFLPGSGEIRRVAERLAEAAPGPAVRVLPLYGDLPAADQEAAIQPSPPGRRKVVLATSIAETSLTIEGVRVVIDAGLSRVPRFSPRTGMTRLETVRVSRAAADQRRGRAGRLGPGVCIRLWSEADDRLLRPHAVPEILEADLAPLALELAVAGVGDPGELRWLDAPPGAAYARARELLRELGALDQSGRVTAHGRAMATLGLHPRLAHMLLRARDQGHGAVACDLAALLGERDVLRGGSGAVDADIRLRLEALQGGRRGRERGAGRAGSSETSAGGTGGAADSAALRRVRAEAALLRQQLGVRGEMPGIDAAEFAGSLLALAYPDRVGQRRADQEGRFLLRSGQGAYFAEPQPLGRSAYIVAAELDGKPRESRIFLAAPIEAAELEAQFADQIEAESFVRWDDTTGSVLARRQRRLGALVLSDAPLRDPEPDAVRTALLEGLTRQGIDALPWSEGARRLRERLAFLHQLDDAWPDVSDAALLASLPEWLGPHLGGIRRRDELARVDLAGALLGRLDWKQRARLDELAPTHVEVPSGSRIAVDYGDPGAPVLAVRLQEVFGWTETPRVGGGTVPLTLHLLSPAQRPVQVTRDLAGFWRTTYFDVKKDLKGRYPKHYWPDDPLQATPTRRVRPRGG